ncbi:leucyl/phenylalanyl-tRNA--protein transferase [Ravibacter arvi]|uniref:Leucyl/phenylalanyl-tRNA--protein transferase n=1 Tax=Ravibacter arvi TaxID=2051041 RepID=A0ABP8M9P8_9BACT
MKAVSGEDLIYGYVHGVFPMAEKDGTLYWYSPDPRAIIPIETYREGRSLRPVLRKRTFEVGIDHNFERVMRYCAAPRENEPETWISEGLIAGYTELHKMGHAHSVECYLDGELVGGLYGVAIGAAFFGESMFHLVSNASKVAFHYLIQILRGGGYTLLDTQFINPNVARYGAIEIPREEYLAKLRRAITEPAKFTNVMVDLG